MKSFMNCLIANKNDFIHKLVFLVILLFASLSLTACGGGGGGSSNTTSSISDTTGGTTGSTGEATTIYGYAQLGNLANATVKIYEIGSDGTPTLKWSETTSSGSTLDEIGKFDIHSTELENDKFYLYEISGGVDWDVNDDGVKDSSSTTNNGTIRAIAKGSEIKNVGENFKVTVLSELVYEKVVRKLKYGFNSSDFANLLKSVSENIINDINGDGHIDIEDILSYDPVNNKSDLKDLYKNKLDESITYIHQGKSPLLNINNILKTFDLDNDAISVQISPDYTKAFIGEYGTQLEILDLTTDNITQLNLFNVGDNPKGIAISSDGNTLYLAEGTKFEILDVSNPNSPSILKTITVTNAHDVALSNDGNTAFLADDTSGLRIFNVQTPASASQIGIYDTPGKAYSVTLSSDNSKAYIADNDRLVVLDITTLSSPTLYDNIALLGTVSKVVLSNDETKAYIADGAEGLKIIDLTHGSLSQIGELITSGIVEDIKISNSGERIFASAGDLGVYVIDITSASNPELLSRYNISSPLYNIFLSNDETKAYIAANNKFQIIDISDYNNHNFNIVNTFKVNEPSYSIALSDDGDTIYLGGYDLNIIDVSNSDNYSLIKNYTAVGILRKIILGSRDFSKDYLYAADYSKGLRILNISDPDNITEVGATSGSIVGVGLALASHNTRAYLAAGNQGIKLINIDDPTNPTVIKNFTIGGYACDMVLSEYDDKGYVADGNNGIYIVDTHDLNDLAPIDQYNSSGFANGIALGDNEIVYLAASYGGFIIINTLSLFEISQIDTDGDAYKVVLSNDKTKAYVATKHGIQIIDITDPYHPNIIRTYHTLDKPKDLVLSPDETKIYIASTFIGLEVLDLNLFN